MALPATDTFTTDTDQALTDYSASWSNALGAFKVFAATDNCTCDTSNDEGGAYWNADTFADNQYSQGVIGASSGANVIGLSVRASSNNYYGAYSNDNNDYLFETIAGGWNQLGTVGTGIDNADEVYLEVDGENLTYKINAATRLGPTSDDSLSSGSAGLSGYGNSTSPTIDNWEGGNLGGGVSGSASLSPSSSPSVSESVSASTSGSASVSPSSSPSVSESVSESASGSASGSASLSPSSSPSASGSASGSASLSPSSSPSVSESVSESVSASASPSLTAGEVVWGHDTGVLEANVRDFSGNWTGTGVIAGAGDAEHLELETLELMVSEVVYTDECQVTLLQNNYDPSGDDVTMEYRHGATQVACEGAGWNNYVSTFNSLGYVQIRMTSTL